MAEDPILFATLLEQGGTVNSTLVNELIARLSAGSIRVKNRTLTAPPGSPAEFDAHIIGAGTPSDDWLGRFTDEIAFFINGVWEFIPQTAGGTLEEGLHVRVQAEDVMVVWNGTAWVPVNTTGLQTLVDSGGNIAWDVSKGRGGLIVLDGNHAFSAPTNLTAGDTLYLIAKQDGTGTRVPTWNAAFTFPGGTDPTLSTGTTDVDMLHFFAESSSVLRFMGIELDLS